MTRVEAGHHHAPLAPPHIAVRREEPDLQAHLAQRHRRIDRTVEAIGPIAQHRADGAVLGHHEDPAAAEAELERGAVPVGPALELAMQRVRGRSAGGCRRSASAAARAARRIAALPEPWWQMTSTRRLAWLLPPKRARQSMLRSAAPNNRRAGFRDRGSAARALASPASCIPFRVSTDLKSRRLLTGRRGMDWETAPRACTVGAQVEPQKKHLGE